MWRLAKRGLRKLAKEAAPATYLQRLSVRTEIRTHDIIPTHIRHQMAHDDRINPLREQILSGDWDVHARLFAETPLFKAVDAVLTRGERWSEQAFYGEMTSRIKAGTAMWGCTNESTFQERLRGIERLYRDIRDDGYRPRHNFDEISVGIGRYGEVMLYDGEHRLAIATLLQLQSVPVRIIVRHPQWARFKTYVLEYANSHSGGTYAPLLHPDLEWVSSFYGHKRFEIIRKVLSVTSGTVLDIGCNWGYFCHRFEALGFECTGVERDPGNSYVLETLKRAANLRFDSFCGSIFDYKPGQPKSFDVVLALAIFHHFLKTADGVRQLRTFLSELRCSELYYIPHRTTESQMQDAFWNPGEEEVLRFLGDNAGLHTRQHIGSAEDGRAIFKLSR